MVSEKGTEMLNKIKLLDKRKLEQSGIWMTSNATEFLINCPWLDLVQVPNLIQSGKGLINASTKTVLGVEDEY
jgi:hypothetical protein